MEHYLDNAATTRVCPEAAEAAVSAMLENYGNPSSTHTRGRTAKKLLDESRKTVSDALGCMPSELVFTSCGSESDNWALIGGAEYMKHRGKHIISSVVEHDAVRKSLDYLETQGYEVTRLRPDSSGAIPVSAVEESLRDDTVLVSLMMVNNETGAVTDISGISSALKRSGSKALLHTDAVQAFMKLPFKAKTLGADMISISGHKVHAPKGIGALYVKNGIHLKPYIRGGAQEDGRRAGTEAMPQIAAFAAAVKLAAENLPANIEHMNSMKLLAVETLRNEIPEIVIIGSEAPHILSVSLPGWRSEVLMNVLESKEVYVSKSSACKKGARSHVLEAIGLSGDVIDGAIRIGLSRYTDENDINALCTELKNAKNSLSHR